MTSQKMISKMERCIAQALIKSALDNDMALRVYDGEGWANTRQTKSWEEVEKELFSTDTSTLYYYSRFGSTSLGWVLLVPGNDGYDVISDHSTNLADMGLLKDAERLASKFEEGTLRPTQEDYMPCVTHEPGKPPVWSVMVLKEGHESEAVLTGASEYDARSLCLFKNSGQMEA